MLAFGCFFSAATNDEKGKESASMCAVSGTAEILTTTAAADRGPGRRGFLLGVFWRII